MSESDPSDVDPGDIDHSEVDEIRERKREELTATAPSPDEPIHVEDADHFDALRGDHPRLLVDFHADWCGPCQMLDPIVEDVAAESDAAVAKVDIDAHQSIAREFGVRSVPTLLLFSDGHQAEQVVGVQERETLLDLIERTD